MRVLVQNEIRKAIEDCKPSHIAVAYIGSDWRKYISNPNNIEAIIISPTFGTNPQAVTDLARKIGWGKIFFLDELHAKVYIGKNSAVLGSANLTNNGLCGQALIELCVEVNNALEIKKIKRNFDAFKQKAQKNYPSTESKKEQIKELRKIRNRAITNRIIPREYEGRRKFTDFELLTEDDLYVVYYNEILSRDDLKEIKNTANFIINDLITFSEKDQIKEDTWVLTWKITGSQEPHKSAKLGWLYIHETFNYKNENYKYPQLAIERGDKKTPCPPFKITKKVEEAFKKVVVEDGIAKYLIQSDSRVWNLNYSLKGIPLLVKRMKQYMAG